MTYKEALDTISALQGRGWRLGLDRMEKFLEVAGLSEALGHSGTPRFVHIAGTNGKGTTTAIVQSILCEAGLSVGGYFSPYVYSPRERIQWNGNLIAKEDFVATLERLMPAIESMSSTPYGGVTEFEVKTAMGFAFWQAKKCEWVACEVGLGGRLDATNVLSPASCAIVSIGLDHVNILGHSYGEIAQEKAGVLKSGKPGVIGEMNEESSAAVKRVAADVDAPLWWMGREVVLERSGDAWTVAMPSRTLSGLRLNLSGAKSAHNMAVAIATVEAAGADLDEEAIREGVARAWIPGRFQRERIDDVEVILDGAHNTESAQTLAESMQAHFPGRAAVLLSGMVDGHDPKPFYEPLLPHIHSVHLAPIDFFRGLPPSDLKERSGLVAAHVHNSLNDAVQAALADAGCDRPLLVTGSFYLVGEVGRLLRVRGCND